MPDNIFLSQPLPLPIGLLALIEELGLRVRLPAVRSSAVAGTRRTHISQGLVEEQYPRKYAPANLIGHLRFALRYEPIDLGVLTAIFRVIDEKLLTTWLREDPTGIFARRAWYLYERITGRTLDIPDVAPTGYADLLDPRLHITGPVRRSRRHRINDNQLGDFDYSPLIRRTPVLTDAMSAGWDRQARALVAGTDPSILARAVQFLYTQETKSSFAIEGESPSPDRSARFVAALSHAAEFNSADPGALIRLQNIIVDPRYAAQGWRTVQNYVSRTRSDFSEHVYYVCPRPTDVSSLMDGWMRLITRLQDAAIDPVCAAAAASFGFVFIHPFEDGNGRIHRFLIHQILSHTGFTPESLVFPVSSVMLRDRRAYDQVLDSYSRLVLPFIEYDLDEHGQMTVRNDTADLYRYWDATAFAEYLYGCVAETIEHDLREELGFLAVFDEAVRKTMDIVDMPDRRASLLVRLILQNRGTLSNTKRTQFSELTDEEVAAIQSVVQACLAASPVPRRN